MRDRDVFPLNDPFAGELLSAQSRMGEGLLLADGERIVDANDAFCRLSGYSRPELRAFGSPWRLLGSEWMWRPSQHGPAETSLARKSGESVPVELRTSFVRGEAGQVLAIVRDLTDVKTLDAVRREVVASRPLVRLLIRELTSGRLGSGELVAAGKDLAWTVGAATLQDHLDAFRDMGLGDLTVWREGPVWRVDAHDLLALSGGAGSCDFVRGYLEGASRLVGIDGARVVEVECARHGGARCSFSFVVRP